MTNPESQPEVKWESIERYLKEKKGWIDAVVVSGGEPTTDKGLPLLLKNIKQMNLKTKIFTNGTDPDIIRYLIDSGLADSFSIDIKAPLNSEKYRVATGGDVSVDNIVKSVKIIIENNIDSDFRTTLVPTIFDGEDFKGFARELFYLGIKKIILQQFVPRDTLDPTYLNIKPYSQDFIKEIVQDICFYIKDVEIS